MAPDPVIARGLHGRAFCLAGAAQGRSIRRGVPRRWPRSSVARTLLAWLASLVLGGCAPLSHSIVSLDGSDTGNLAAVALLSTDSDHPLLLRGVDGQPLGTVRVPNAFRSWSFVLAPGKHLLWVSSVPYGHPLLPQFIRCYAMDVSLEPGSHHVLQYEPTHEEALLRRQGGTQAVATGRLVDKPLMLERNCRWQ